MGLSSKHVSGDPQAGFEWGAAELSKPPSIRRPPPSHHQPEPLNCPRCNSVNTKFCYYNNYNKSQPRHFCKSCKRHWTKGGTLRNVPVGGGRKNKRPKISKPTTAASAAAPAAAAPRQQDQKSMSSILYQALMHETTKGIMGSIDNGVNTANSAGLNESTSEYQFSSLNSTTFDMNVSWNPITSYQPLNAFDHHYGGNLDSIEESTITTVNNIPSGPWAGPESSSIPDLPNYWNWSDIDVLNSTDLNISWDDDDDDDDNADVKPPENKFQD
ncbi:hypothetical protein ACS0TY_031277 [Phlomoides rotata]